MSAAAVNVPPWMTALSGGQPGGGVAVKQVAVRVLILLNLTLLSAYMVWRGLYTLNWALWPFSLALFAAEIYSFIDSALFCFGMWRIRERGEPPPPPDGATVDVFITCYNESVDLVRATARAAKRITYRHETFVLDDGDSAAMAAMAAEEGVGYVTRGATWDGKDRHAKAGNLINALYHTEGQFVLVLDADHVPKPEFLDRTLGYFDDPLVACVQTPQWFRNIPPGDPFGADAPLFYGPIQQGKDGWNAAFFCGSNAVLRRDALMTSGIATYAKEMGARVRTALRGAPGKFRRAAMALDPESVHAAPVWKALRMAGSSARKASNHMASGARLQEVTWTFQSQIRQASEDVVARDSNEMDVALSSTPGVPHGTRLHPNGITFLKAKPNWPLAAIPVVRQLMADVDLDRADQAEPVQPLATISVTEDMATAMRLHAMGYRTVYHHEILAVGLAPDDLRSMLQQRLRWAQGTMQVFLRENPLFQRGLSWPQRLLYFSTMWSYLSGFASVVYLISPVLYLFFGWLPVHTLNGQFLLYLLPCLVVNQLLFALVGYGMRTWRGQQYSLALFPLWIKAVVTTVRNVYFGERLPFVVTPKTRQGGAQWSLVRPQIATIAILAFACVYGLGQIALGLTETPFPILINVAWSIYSILMLSVVIGAARWHPPLTESQP